MELQGQSYFRTREFRIAVIAIAAVAALAVGAYLFGSRLQADTSASVAPSPLGSSLTAVRASTSEDYVGRLINASEASRAAALAALAKSRSDFHADQSNAAAAASAVAANRFRDRYDRMNSSPAAVSAALLDMLERSGSADYSARAAGLWFDIPAAGSMASRPAVSQSRAALLDMIERSGSAGYAARAAGLWFDIPASRPESLETLAERWAPFYAGLDTAMTAAGARSAQGSSSSMVESSTGEQFQWIKPEGIKPSEGSDSEAGLQWIKPEGVTSKQP